MARGTLARAIVRARGRHDNGDWKDLRYTSLKLFNHIIVDLRDGCMDCSWIDVICKYSSVIKVPPDMRHLFTDDISEAKKRLCYWYFDEDKHKMVHRQPRKVDTFERLGKKDCLLKDVVFEIVVKMYELSYDRQQREGLDKEGMELFDEIKKFKFDSNAFRIERRRELSKFELDYQRKLSLLEGKLESARRAHKVP